MDTATTTPTFITKWGTFGSADGQFYNPIGIATDASGNVYVTDLNNYHVQKSTSEGVFLTKWGSQGSANGEPLMCAIQYYGRAAFMSDPRASGRLARAL